MNTKRLSVSHLAGSIAIHLALIAAIAAVLHQRSSSGVRVNPTGRTPIEVSAVQNRPQIPSAARAPNPNTGLGSNAAPSASSQGSGQAPGTPSKTTGTPSALQSYGDQVRAQIQNALEYPISLKRRRVTGTALVHLSIADPGTLTQVRLARSSGHPELDESAIRSVRKAAPFPPKPQDLPSKTGVVDFDLPVEFRLR